MKNQNQNTQNKQKIALTFFGITRSLKFTLESIDNNMIHVLKNAGYDVDIFLHTYTLENYKNVRAGENKKEMDNTEYELLKPKYFIVESQDEVKTQLKLEEYRSKPDPWKTKYNSVDNFILAQYSKFRITNLIEEKELENDMKYDYIIYFRPDCLYHHKFNVDYLKLCNDKTIVIPSFSLFGKHKFNDRFAVCSSENYKYYGKVFSSILDTSKKKPLHSETVLSELLIETYKLSIKRVKFNFSRVRCNGKVKKENF
tara:strand:+ start:5589 stop:6356 length:768 start_codon:yes stop_codon:yes gene_type:complete